MLLACYTIKVHTWSEATLFNSDNLCIIAKEGIVLLKYWEGQEMSQPDYRGIEIFLCPERGAKRRGVVFRTVASIPPNLKSKSGASPPIFGLMFPPLSGSTLFPFPFGLRSFFASSAPFSSSFSVLRFPMLYPPFPLRSPSHSRSFLFPFPRGPTPS